MRVYRARRLQFEPCDLSEGLRLVQDSRYAISTFFFRFLLYVLFCFLACVLSHCMITISDLVDWEGY